MSNDYQPLPRESSGSGAALLDPSQLSVQLYSVRSFLDADREGTLARIAAIGFTQVELYGFVTEAEAFAEALSAYGLTAPSAHAHLVGEDPAPVFTAAGVVGVGTVIDPSVDEARWETRDSITGIARDFNELALRASDYGLRVGYHNHTLELERIVDGVSALEILADSLAPEVVLEVDTYWAAVGGQDVPALLSRLGERVQLLHIKDGPITKNDLDQTSVGQGRMPVPDILAAAPAALAVVELDDFAGDMVAALSESYRYLTAPANA